MKKLKMIALAIALSVAALSRPAIATDPMDDCGPDCSCQMDECRMQCSWAGPPTPGCMGGCWKTFHACWGE